jgi:hypothetical protein
MDAEEAAPSCLNSGDVSRTAAAELCYQLSEYQILIIGSSPESLNYLLRLLSYMVSFLVHIDCRHQWLSSARLPASLQFLNVRIPPYCM